MSLPAPPARALLCVANFPSNTGYAWDYIEGIYAHIANRLSPKGIRTFVAYPSIPSPPRTLSNSTAEPIVLDASLNSEASQRAVADFVRKENVQVFYCADAPVVRLAYARLKASGVRKIIVHDHTSGDRRAPHGSIRLLKWLWARTPLAASDCVVAVSDFVAQRQLRIGLVPPNRVVRIYNSVAIPASTQPEQRAALKRELGIAEDRPLIACACRATPEKGVAHLLRAFDIAARKLLEKIRPALVYIGEGPFLPKLRHLRETLSSQNDIFLVGYKPDAASLLEGADICVVPSVWQEAFGLAVAEPMARGKAVIASRVGAIPELIENGVSGLLVEPGDEQSLSSALVNLLENPDRASALGKGAKLRIASMFTLEKKLASLLPLIEGGFSPPLRPSVAAASS